MSSMESGVAPFRDDAQDRQDSGALARGVRWRHLPRTNRAEERSPARRIPVVMESEFPRGAIQRPL